jgi:lysophospholipase L1-like esterase
MYGKVIGEECKKGNISFLNVAGEWLKSDYLKLLSKDGIHPNEKGHQKIFEKIKPLFT